MFFSTQYSSQFQDIKCIISKNLPILYIDDSYREVLSQGVKYVARKAHTLGNMVSPSAYVSNPPTPQACTDVEHQDVQVVATWVTPILSPLVPMVLP